MTYRELQNAAHARGVSDATRLVESGAPLPSDYKPAVADLLILADALTEWTPGDAASDILAEYACAIENNYSDHLFS